MEEINLEGNNITEIESGTFLGLSRLKYVNLESNFLKTLSMNSLKVSNSVGNSSFFHLSSNPFLCDCSLHQTFLSVSHPSHTADLEDLSCTLIPTQANQPPLSPVPQLQFRCWYTQHYFSLCRCYTFLTCDCRMKSSPCTCLLISLQRNPERLNI